MVVESKEKQHILSQLKKVVDTRFDKIEAPWINDFIAEYYRDVACEDLHDRELDDLYGAAIAHWNLAQSRPPAATQIKVYNPSFETHGWQSAYSVIEIVTEDHPFLVNSLTMNLNENGLTCHLVVHPVIDVCRDGKGLLQQKKTKKGLISEAMIRLEVDLQSAEAGGLKRLREQMMRVVLHNAAVTEDWKPCLAKLGAAVADLQTNSSSEKIIHHEETMDFLAWLGDGSFLFLGCREYELVKGKGGTNSGFKIVKDSGLGILRDQLAVIPNMDVIPMTHDISGFMNEPNPLIVTKATTKSIIHRSAYMDYVGVKKFNTQGQVVGEYRFLGLYTSSAYHQQVSELPLIRNKVQKVFSNSAFKLNSHNGKSLMNVLNGLPRDELFHSNDDELLSLALGVLQLRERQRIRLFARCDTYGQFVSILIYVPRDRYNTSVRKKMERVVCKKLETDRLEFNVEFSDSMFARVHFTVHTSCTWSGAFSASDMEGEIIDILRDWKDDLLEALVLQLGEAVGTELYNRYGDGFSIAYQDSYPVRFAVSDIEKSEALNLNAEQNIQLSLYQPLESHGKGLQFKLIHKEEPAPLSQTLPVLENMGVTVFDERPFEMVDNRSEQSYWLHDFGLRYKDDLPSVESLKQKFQTLFEQVWIGHVENDGFNQLVIKANLGWKKIALLRAYYLYLRQTGIAFSQSYVEETLANNAEIAGHLVGLFELKFEPNLAARAKKVKQQETLIGIAIDKVVSLDEDRILRRYLNLIQATTRTSYYQNNVDEQGVPYTAFKLFPEGIVELPSPRPKFEIFVYSPRVEGVHLRGGAVARGGLRWSDRKEDFRTEVLGLMKAQMSKNAVIVPTGAKGGFIVKRSLDGLPRDEMMQEVVECYSIFISALLSITDNLKAESIIPPAQVVRYDEDDPYLVVAADKGTASFSDIANGIALAQGFWLGDAFASGGSVGYDHKKMGITAKGAWESVKRHFRERGLDTQTSEFSVMGIGDMGGDVFGNGMLLSEKICLVGAFNHRHIFLDPRPGAAVSFKERQRLFNLPRSSWSDYDKKLISAGGGIFSRADKSIKLSAEVRSLLDVSDEKLTPNELIQAMLKSPVDLLWNGGIGTYVKSAAESDADVGDRANDSLRINGAELRCKVMGEGGNLGFTQLGRIEYAKRGRINTDAIDNAAGVDCSDHEVNIKILLNKLVELGDMTGKQRDVLLAKMTDKVADLVLRNNYLQTQAISMVETQASTMLEVHARLITQLGQDGRLDRVVEFLPSYEEIEERKIRGVGLYRPELAVVFAYSKLLLKDLMVGSTQIRDPGFKQELMAYFPANLSEHFIEAIHEHRLADEIIVNQLVNSLVNRLGPSFAFRMRDEVGATIDDVIKHYRVACEIFNTEVIWREIEGLDNQVSPDVQIDMLMEVRRLIERTMYWLQSNRGHIESIGEVVSEFAEGVAEVSREMVNYATVRVRGRIHKQAAIYQAAGVNESLAIKISSLELESTSLDVIAIHSVVKCGKDEVLPVFFAVIELLEVNWLYVCISRLSRKNYWQSLARSALRNDLHTELRVLSSSIFQSVGGELTAEKRLSVWRQNNRIEIERYLHLVSVIQAENEIQIEQLSVLLKEFHVIVEKSKLKLAVGAAVSA